LNGFIIAAITMVTVLQAHAGIQAGAKEVQLFGSLMNDSTGDTDSQTLMFGSTINNYIKDTMSFGLVAIMMQNSSDNSDSSMVTLQGRTDLYMCDDPAAPTVPYVGLDLGTTIVTSTYESYNYWSGTTEQTTTSASLSYGVHGGVKVFTSETSSVNVEAKWNSYKMEDAEESSSQLSLNVGLSVYFF